MVRVVLTRLLLAAVRLFFRRIEVTGVDRVPATGPVIFAINHPNGLVDPLLVLCHAPRPVSFLGKAPLFRMPVIGWLARAFDAIPVYRHRDAGSDVRQNRETFARARALLDRGGTIAIAPEGVSHDDPRLRPLKTGAARIALGAGTTYPVTIVPVGLFYTDKAVFRSAALVCFGEPFPVTPVPLDARGEPPAAQVAAVSARIDEALSTTVVEADDHESDSLVIRAERLLSAALPGGSQRGLEEVLAARQALTEGHRRLRQTDPDSLDHLIRRIDRLEAAFQRVNIHPAEARPTALGLRGLALGIWWLTARIVVFLPLALPGLVVHFPAYWLIGRVAKVLARGHRDVVATIKIIAAAVFYPLTWIIVAVIVGRQLGAGLAWAALAVGPMTGFAAVKFVERFDRFVSRARVWGFYLTEPDEITRLATARDALRAELLSLADRLGLPTPNRTAARAVR